MNVQFLLNYFCGDSSGSKQVVEQLVLTSHDRTGMFFIGYGIFTSRFFDLDGGSCWITSGILPYALRVTLRVFYFVPDKIVEQLVLTPHDRAGMFFIRYRIFTSRIF